MIVTNTNGCINYRTSSQLKTYCFITLIYRIIRYNER